MAKASCARDVAERSNQPEAGGRDRNQRSAPRGDRFQSGRRRSLHRVLESRYHDRFCAVLVLLLAVAASAQSNRSQADSMALARRVETLLAAPELQKESLGDQVVSLPRQCCNQRNAEKLMQPASTTNYSHSGSSGADRRRLQIPNHGGSSSCSRFEGRIADDLILVGVAIRISQLACCPSRTRTELQGSTTQALEDLADQVVKSGWKQVTARHRDDTYYLWEYPTWTRRSAVGTRRSGLWLTSTIIDFWTSPG